MASRDPEFLNLAKDVKIFHGLEPSELEIIIPYLQKCTFVEGDWVVKEGSDADSMYIICRGNVEVWKSAEGREQGFRLGELIAGDCFGEMALVDCQRRSASVLAQSDLVAYSLSYYAMGRIYEEAPRLYGLLIMNIAREISRRLRSSDKTVAEFALPSEPPRAVHHL